MPDYDRRLAKNPASVSPPPNRPFLGAQRRARDAPKVYVRDSGLLHALLGIRAEKDLLAHPKSGVCLLRWPSN